MSFRELEEATRLILQALPADIVIVAVIGFMAALALVRAVRSAFL